MKMPGAAALRGGLSHPNQVGARMRSSPRQGQGHGWGRSRLSIAWRRPVPHRAWRQCRAVHQRPGHRLVRVPARQAVRTGPGQRRVGRAVRVRARRAASRPVLRLSRQRRADTDVHQLRALVRCRRHTRGGSHQRAVAGRHTRAAGQPGHPCQPHHREFHGGDARRGRGRDFARRCRGPGTAVHPTPHRGHTKGTKALPLLAVA